MPLMGVGVMVAGWGVDTCENAAGGAWMPVRSADKQVLPALQVTIAALDPPASDAALVRLAEVTASAIDAMAVEVQGTMLGQTAPLLLKLLQELEARAARRRPKAGAGGRGKVAGMRQAHVTSFPRRAG